MQQNSLHKLYTLNLYYIIEKKITIHDKRLFVLELLSEESEL